MKDGKRNLMGDLVMSSVVGCAAFIGFICLSLMIGGMFVLIHSIINK